MEESSGINALKAIKGAILFVERQVNTLEISRNGKRNWRAVRLENWHILE